ncbi:hypothetical protein AB1N83_001236 [Pleurotus pulmonarius]
MADVHVIRICHCGVAQGSKVETYHCITHTDSGTHGQQAAQLLRISANVAVCGTCWIEETATFMWPTPLYKHRVPFQLWVPIIVLGTRSLCFFDQGTIVVRVRTSALENRGCVLTVGVTISIPGQRPA